MSDVWITAREGDLNRLKEFITKQGVSINTRSDPDGVSDSYLLYGGYLHTTDKKEEAWIYSSLCCCSSWSFRTLQVLGREWS